MPKIDLNTWEHACKPLAKCHNYDVINPWTVHNIIRATATNISGGLLIAATREYLEQNRSIHVLAIVRSHAGQSYNTSNLGSDRSSLKPVPTLKVRAEESSVKNVDFSFTLSFLLSSRFISFLC